MKPIRVVFLEREMRFLAITEYEELDGKLRFNRSNAQDITGDVVFNLDYYQISYSLIEQAKNVVMH